MDAETREEVDSPSSHYASTSRAQPNLISRQDIATENKYSIHTSESQERHSHLQNLIQRESGKVREWWNVHLKVDFDVLCFVLPIVLPMNQMCDCFFLCNVWVCMQS